MKTKRILLKCNEEFFYKLKEDKLKREKEMHTEITWEEYIDLLFCLTKIKRGK